MLSIKQSETNTSVKIIERTGSTRTGSKRRSLSMSMTHWHKFALAASFVTCFPLARIESEESLSSLSKYLPVVGLFLGVLLAGLCWLLHQLNMNVFLSAVILTLSWIGITGAIHFDGLMDTADGVLSHRTPERMLEIMSDSRVGNFGAITGFGVMLLKIACLASLPYVCAAQSFLLIPCWARFCETYAIGAFHYLRPAGMGKIWHDTTRFPADLYSASAIPMLATACVFYFNSTIALVASLATITCGVIASFRINKILRGHTGDTYGAVVELAETGGLLILALFVHG